MRRPFWIIGCAILVTMAVVFSFSLDPVLLGGGLLVAGLVLALLPIPLRKLLAVLFLSAALGCGVVQLYLQGTVEPLKALDGQGITVTGVLTEQEHYSNSWAYWIKGNLVTQGGEELEPVTVKVLSTTGQNVQVGDWVQVTGQAQWNIEGAFASYSFSKGEFLSLWLEGELESADPGRAFWRSWIPTLRQRLLTAVERAIPQQEEAAVVCSMVFGDSSDLSLHQEIVLRRAGTVHFTAVSGLHVTLVGFLCLALFTRLLRKKRLVLAVTVGGIWLFVALVGWSPSAVRAGFMLSVMYLGQLLSQRSDSLNSLGLAITVMTLMSPNVALDVGFWMSVCATAGILLLAGPLEELLRNRFFPRVTPKGRKVLSLFAVGICALVAVSLVTLVQFGYVTPLSPMASLVVSPLAPILLVFGIFTALLGQVPLLLPLAKVTGWVGGLCASILWQVSEIFAKIPFSAVSVDRVGRYFLLWLPAVLVVGGVLLYRRRGKLLACWSLLSLLVLLVSALFQQVLYQDTLTVWLPQDGQAMVIQQGDRCAVVGGFSSLSKGNSLAQSLAIQGLQVDVLVVTQEDGDRLSGLIPLLEELPVQQLILPEENNQQATIDSLIPRERQTPLQDMDITLFGNVTLQVRSSGKGEARVTLTGTRIPLVKTEESVIIEENQIQLVVGEDNTLSATGPLQDAPVGIYESAQGGWTLLLPIS